MNRRQLLAQTSVLIAAGSVLRAQAQSDATSAGIGLTLEDVLSLYEELPVGQSYRNFAHGDSGAALYMDFGNDDLVQRIWVSGEMTELDALNMMVELLPSDALETSRFDIADGSGSIATQVLYVYESEALRRWTGSRSTVLAQYVRLPNDNLVESVRIVIENGQSPN